MSDTVSIESELEWISSANERYGRGIPEPAIDGAGDLLDVALAALLLLQEHPDLAREFERRLLARREDNKP